MDNIATHILHAKDEAGNDVKIIRRGPIMTSATRGVVPLPGQSDHFELHYELPGGRPLAEEAGGRLCDEATGRVFTDLRA